MELSELYDCIIAAEAIEKWARELLYEEPKLFACIFEYGSVNCRECKRSEECEAEETVRENAADTMMEKAFEMYHDALGQARLEAKDSPTAAVYACIARLLLDIAINPLTPDVRESPSLYEAQSIYYQIYEQTGNMAFLEQARMCESFRNASVVEYKK